MDLHAGIPAVGGGMKLTELLQEELELADKRF
jgi:hypothetical protein